MDAQSNIATIGAIKGLRNGEIAAALILCGAILLNPLLAVINGHIIALSRTHVALAEAGLVAGACLIIVLNAKRAMAPWLFLALVLLTLQLFLAAINQAFSPKYIRDVIIIPVFVMLGMAYIRGNIVRLFCAIQLTVLLFLLMEAAFLDAFSGLFQIVRYYINTRDVSQASFWNSDLDLFVSATRPTERFLASSLGLHRLSSIFLEPVSLGNYCIVMTIFTLAFWERMAFRTKLFLITSTAVLLVGSDGRLATVTCAVLLLGGLTFPLLPRYTPVMYLPVVLVVAVATVHALDLTPNADDFGGRTAGSVQLLSDLSARSLLGLNPFAAGSAMDTGIVYLLLTQSILGVVAIWLSVSFAAPPSSRACAILVHGVCIYISLNLLVSYSLFSIKTAAPLWFMYGYAIREALICSCSPPGFVLANNQRGSGERVVGESFAHRIRPAE